MDDAKTPASVDAENGRIPKVDYCDNPSIPGDEPNVNPDSSGATERYVGGTSLAEIMKHLPLLPDEPTVQARRPTETGERVAVERLLEKASQELAASGQRNDAGFYLAAQLRDAGYSIGEALWTMQEYRRSCPTKDHPFTEAEAERTLRSAYRTPPRDQWARGTASGRTENTWPQWALKRSEDYKALRREWLVEGVLPTNSYVVIYGPPGSGKSLLVLGMVKAIACGQPWFEKQVRQGGVLWVALEGECDIYGREQAIKEHHGLGGQAAILYIDEPLNLSDTEQVREFAARMLTEKPPEWGGKPPAVVVIDTLSNAMEGDENGVEAFRPVNANATLLRKLLGCTVIAIHHASKGDEENLRGSSSFLGAVDLSACVRSSGDGDGKRLRLRCKKVRGCRGFADIHAAIVEVNGVGPLAVSAQAPGKQIVEGIRLIVRCLREDFTELGARQAEWQRKAAERAEREFPSQLALRNANNLKRWMREAVEEGYVLKRDGDRNAPYTLTEPGKILALGQGIANDPDEDE